MLFDLRSGLIIQVLLLTGTSSSDIEDFRSFLPPDNERENYEALANSPYMSFTQHGNNFFFKPNIDLGPKYVKHPFNSPNYKDTIPMEPILTKYVDADLKQQLQYPPVSPLATPKIPEAEQKRPNTEIIPIAKMGEDTQVILGHREPLPTLKGSLNVRELVPILYQFIQPYLQNANKQKQVQPYIKPQRSEMRRDHHCGPRCNRPQVNIMGEMLMRDTYAQMQSGGYIPYL